MICVFNGLEFIVFRLKFKITIYYKKSSYRISEKGYKIKKIPYKKADNCLPAF